MGGNAGRQIRCVVGKMGKVQPHADTHQSRCASEAAPDSSNMPEILAPPTSTSFGHFIDTALRSDERGNRIGQCKPGHKTQLSGLLRLNAPGLINGGHQISLRRLPHPPATPATGALGIGQNPMRLNHPLSRQPFGFFIGAVQGFKVEQLIGIGKCDHLMSAARKALSAMLQVPACQSVLGLRRRQINQRRGIDEK